MYESRNYAPWVGFLPSSQRYGTGKRDFGKFGRTVPGLTRMFLSWVAYPLVSRIDSGRRWGWIEEG